METNEEKMKQGVTHIWPGDGRSLRILGEVVTYKITSERTGGAYSLFEVLTHPGGGPPPHVQHREDEAFWVLEGELEVSVGGERFRAGAGSFVHLPKGVLHSYRNVGTGPARFLTLLVPAGLEKYFEEVGKPGTDFSSPPLVEQEDIDRLLAAAPKYGVEIKPPPEP